MDEYIDIVTHNGEPTNKVALKSEAHQKGWYHNTIHLWLFSKIGEILLQQRSHKKNINPLLWDVSVAGHVDANETCIEAALRETQEELGLSLLSEDLIKIGIEKYEKSYHNGAIQDNEFQHVYIVELKVSVDDLTLQLNEVEAVKLVSLETFSELIASSSTNNHFIPDRTAYYQLVLEQIKTHLVL